MPGWNDDSPFEGALKRDEGRMPEAFRTALIEVADTAYLCKLWFKSYGLEATAADVMTMAQMVMKRELYNRKREEF